MIHFKDNKNKSALSTRWAQMSKQEQIIERKKMEIQAKLESQKQAAALAAQAKLTNPTKTDDKGSANIFSNDGSFMSQFKALLQKQNQEKQIKEEEEKAQEEELIQNEYEDKQYQNDEDYERDQFAHQSDNRRKSNERGSRDKHRRWGDKGRSNAHSPSNPGTNDRMKHNPHNIPSLMQIPVMPPNNESSDSEHKQWISQNSDEEDDSNMEQGNMNASLMGSRPMPPDYLSPSLMGPGPGMAPGSGIGPGPGMGPGHGMVSGPGMGLGPGMGPGPNMGPRTNMGMGLNMGPGQSMGSGQNMGPRPNMGPGPNMGPRPNMGPGLNMGPRPNMGTVPNSGPGPTMGPGPMGGSPNMGMGPGPNMGGGPNMGPMMGPRGPMPPMPPGGPMPPFMGGPPNFPMPPNFMGPNGPGGPCGPMPPNMCGPNGPNGPMPPFFGPPFPNPMMGSNGPPNSMMPPNSLNNNMPFMGPRPPFGPNGPPSFGNGNGPPMSFMPPNTMPSNSIPPPPASESDNTSDSLKVPNIPAPMLMNHMPNQNNMEPDPMKNSQVLSADALPPSVQRAASEVARNGDHWEHVLKAIQLQDQNLWFLNNTNSNEYKAFRQLVSKIRSEQGDIKPHIKPEDKYDPEFSLEDDDSYDQYPKQRVKEDSSDGYRNFKGFSNVPRFEGVKREQASSQSDDEPDNDDTRRERRKKKKSRWSDEPPAADIKPPGVIAPLLPGVIAPLPPGVMAPLPPGLPGAHLAKIDEEGLKLTNVNRNNQALMQYAMTNYGTTNLSPEDWKKCEDNFKLNLLYQDMLKKRQEVEKLAAAGKYKYEYDSDEDTAEGTWEHKLRSKEMNATEKWATELTKQAAGKHHIGDFLPPEELKKFMEKYSAFKSGKEPDLSDYKEFKLKEDNVGFKMLQKLGWNEGQGLGAEGSGIVDPINKANQQVSNLGLGAANSDVVSPDDDEFDAYRKRMMLAYRFRPNPLNNPRRPYY